MTNSQRNNSSLSRSYDFRDSADVRIASVYIPLLIPSHIVRFRELTSAYPRSVPYRTRYMTISVYFQELTIVTGRHP